MVFKNLFLVIILLISISLAAQDEPSRSRLKRKSQINFRQYGPPIHQAGNEILLYLAAANDESPRNLIIGISFTEEITILRYPERSPDVTIRLTETRPFITIQYRGFNIDDILTPNRVSCNLNLVNLSDSMVLRQYRLSDLDIKQLETGYKSSLIPVVEEGKMMVTLSDYLFHYDHDALKRFRERIQLANDYFASTALVASLLQATESWDPTSVEDLPEKYIQLMEINKVIRLLEAKNIEEKLNLESYDPEDFSAKFVQLDKFSRSASMTLEQQLSDLSLQIPESDLELLSEIYFNQLSGYIQRSMLMNGIRGSIYEDYLDTWFQLPGFRNDQDLFVKLVGKMYPHKDTDKAIERISLIIWESYKQKAGNLIRASQFAEALKLLENANEFADHNPALSTGDVLHSLKSMAVKGIYASYLGIAESCIDKQKYKMADSYVTKADDYHKSYPGLILSDTLFQRVFRKLFSRRLSECDLILAARQYHDALDCYSSFGSGYPPDMIAYVNDHIESGRQQALKGLFFEQNALVAKWMHSHEEDSALACYDHATRIQALISADPDVFQALGKLNKRMLPVRYKKLSDWGTYLYLTYKHEAAFRTFDQLKEIGIAIGIEPDTSIERMYRESYKHHMLNEISMATGMIWKDELDQARAYVKEMESVMDLYHLELDPDLRSALRGYRQKIDRKICMNIIQEVESLSARAERNLEMKQFDVAVMQLGEALQQAQQHPECKIPTDELVNTIKRYLSAAFYQEKLKQARDQVATGNYRDALQSASDNELFYRNKNLALQKVPFISTLDFVNTAARVPMTTEAVIFFIRTGNEPAALASLTWLEQADVQAKSVRHLQETLGAAMAETDFRISSSGNPALHLHGYTGSNRWFAKFAQAYTSRWKQLESETIIQNTIKP